MLWLRPNLEAAELLDANMLDMLEVFAAPKEANIFH